MGPRILIVVVGLAVAVGAWFHLGSGDREPASGYGSASPEKIVEEYRTRLVAAVESKAAMNFSVARNPAQFACLSSVSGSCQGAGGNFQLYPFEDPSAQPLTQLAYSTGLQLSGVGCNGFPSATCPLRLESRWVPVCGSGACDNVRTIRVEVSVVYSDGTNSYSAREERLVQPTVQLSESVRCAREQGFYDGRQCVRGNYAREERAVASTADRNGPERAAQEVPANYRPDPRDFPLRCPDDIEIQGYTYPAELVAPGKARVRIPAINNCPGAHDTFIFSCVVIPANENPYARDDEGKWQQSEAITAPPCDEYGNPIGGPVGAAGP